MSQLLSLPEFLPDPIILFYSRAVPAIIDDTELQHPLCVSSEEINPLSVAGLQCLLMGKTIRVAAS